MKCHTINSKVLILVVWALAFCPSCTFGQDHWPQFRGEAAMGVSRGNPPTHWDVETQKNILWQTPVDGLGHSAPIVWGNDVFVTTAVSSDNSDYSLSVGWEGANGKPAPDTESEWQWKLICIDRTNGNIKWSKTAATGKPTIERHTKATHANCTPATDGNHVIAFFGSEGLYCYDFEGNQKWKKDFGKLHSGPYNMRELEWGFASSPVIYNGKVIVQCDCLNTNFVAILNIDNGEEIRRIEREDVATWSTPCVFQWKGQTQVVCNGYKQMASYDMATGDRLWMLSGGGDVPVPTPLFDGKRVHITNGHGRSPAYAVSPDARGDITPNDDSDELPDGLMWYQTRGGAYMPTPIIIGDLLYTGGDNGVLTVRDKATGEDIYKKRVTSGGRNNFSASAIGTESHIYFCAENGNVAVVKTGKEFERIAINKMNEIVMATPAIADDQLFIRTKTHLVCVAEHQPADASQENN